MTATKTAKRTVPFADGDTNRCQFKTDKGRQCKLIIHPDTHKHMFVNREAADHKPLSQVVPSGFSLTAVEVKNTDVLSKGGKRTDTKPRDADQKRVDGHVQKSAGKNSAHNSKTEFGKLAVTEYVVPPAAVDTVLDYLRRAVGTGGPEVAQGMTLRYRRGDHASGNTRLQWAVVKTAPQAAS